MSPNLTGTGTGIFLAGAEVVQTEKGRLQEQKHQKPKAQEPQYEWNIVWRNVLGFIYLHTASIYGIYLLFTKAYLATFIWAYFVTMFAGLGVTAGAHRLWAHRSYKARWPLRVLLAIQQAMAFQNHIYEWVRDHRAHHKFNDTDADPHNVNRGFFFSHMGWLMVRKHPEVISKGKTVDMSDMENDWVVRLQRSVYLVLMPLLCFAFPAWVPVRFWGEDPWTSWYIASILRYTLSLHGTWLVNSAAHIWGMKPYDRFISGTENLTVAILAFGEGWHNYHHAFPWDYKTSEFHGYRTNLTAAFIDLFAKLGLAYDLKKVPDQLILKRARRTGDGSREEKSEPQKELWGWGDADMDPSDAKLVEEYSSLLKREY